MKHEDDVAPAKDAVEDKFKLSFKYRECGK